MYIQVISVFTDLFVEVFTILLIVRALVSFIARPDNRFFSFLISVTEPLLAPVRRILPRSSTFDLSPLVAYFGLQLIRYAVHSILGT